jgi:hemerythrin
MNKKRVLQSADNIWEVTIMKYEWDKSLESGHEMIDNQHKQLFASVNDLLDKCTAGKGKDELSASLDFLTDYTIKHFFDEEKLQQSYNYPEYQKHKQYHDAFKNVVRDLKVRLIMKGPTDELIKDVHTQIGDWLITHIKGNDIKLAAYIKAKDSSA